MGNIGIWYKRANENKYHEITDYIVTSDKVLFSWNRKLYNKLYDFDIKLYSDVVDSDGLTIIPEIGDNITITQNYNGLPYFVFGDNFTGIIETIKENYHGLTSKETDLNVIYDLKVRNKNFSLNNITLKTLVSNSLSSLLDTVLLGVNELGGVNAGGFTIAKYYLNCIDETIQPIDFMGSELNVVSDLLNILGFVSVIKYTLIPDVINNFRLVAQLWIIDPSLVNGGSSNDWVNGISLQTLKDGVIDNIDYSIGQDFNPYIFTEEEITYSKDATNVRNLNKIQAFIKNLSDGALTRYVEIGSDKDTYDLGYSYDVKYVAIDIQGTIAGLSVGSPNTTMTLTGLTAGASTGNVFGGLEYYQTRMNNNNLGGKMVCIIFSSGISYFREFTISAGTLTFVDINIPTLVNGDKFYLVNCFDILKENLSGYPPDGNGYVIKTVGKENSQVKFTAYDAPYFSMPVVIYHYPIVNNYFSNVYNDNVNLLGLRERSEKIDFPITQQQADILMNQYKKFNQPLETLEIKNSWRKSVLNISDQVFVNLRRLNKNMLVTESSGKILTSEGIYKDKNLMVQDLVLATYVDSIDELLAQFSNQNKVTQSQSLLNTTHLINYDSFSIDLVSVSASAPPLVDPIIQTTTNIIDTGFRINWLASNVPDYQINISTDAGFVNIVYSTQVNVAGLQGNPIHTDILFSGYGTLYVRIRAIRGVELSNWSSNSFIQNITGFPLLLPYAIYLKFEEASGQTFNDSSSNNNSGNGTIAGLSSTPTRSGTTPHKSVIFNTNSAIKVIDSPSLLTPNGGTWLFRAKKTTSPTINQTIYAQESANLLSPSNRVLMRIYNTTNVFEFTFWTPLNGTKYICTIRANLVLTNGNYYNIGVTLDLINKTVIVVQDQNILTTSFFVSGGGVSHSNLSTVTSGMSTYSTPLFIGNLIDVIPTNFNQPFTDEMHDFAYIKGDGANYNNTFLSAQIMKNIFNAMV